MGFRDIPMPLVSSGVEHGNLRELALARMKDMGTEVRHASYIYIYIYIYIDTQRRRGVGQPCFSKTSPVCFLCSVEM